MSSYKKATLSTIPIPSLSEEFPFVFDDFSLALHLGVRCKTLWYCVTNKKWMYKTFSIRKANGKLRTIHDPKNILKYVQRRINAVILQRYPLLDCVGAYVPGKGCRDSAARHAGHAIRVGLDVKDFFPTHHRTWVRNFFMRTFGYSHFVSGLLAELCTAQEKLKRVVGDKEWRHFVPQGSPASPTLCNLMAQEAFDMPLLRNLEGTGWVYTRYADDLTLSHPEPQSRAAVDKLIDDVYALMMRAGYTPHRKKLKVQRQGRQQRMLGMVVNEKPNIPQVTYKKYRAIVFCCLKDGFYLPALRYGYDPPEGFVSHLQGKISYFYSINPQKAEKLAVVLEQAKIAHDEYYGPPPE
jgi:retron-type reverse transcriptase